MWIILEGCDGTGKTTLADKLEHMLDALGHNVQRTAHAKLKQHPLLEYAHDYDVWRPGDTWVITDRHYFGELIYGPLWRGASDVDMPMARYLNLFLQKMGALVVFLDLPDKTVKDRLASRGEDLLRMTDVSKVLDSYRIIAENTYTSRVPTMHLRSVPTETQVEDIVKVAAMLYKGAQRLKDYDTFIGNRNPDVLFLGERRSPHKTLPTMPGCFAPVKGTSGHYLFKALDESVTAGRGIALANSVDEEGRLSELWSTLGRPNTVFLGKQAQMAASAAGVPGVTIPHPQYWNRFHHDDVAGYRALITDAIKELEYA